MQAKEKADRWGLRVMKGQGIGAVGSAAAGGMIAKLALHAKEKADRWEGVGGDWPVGTGPH